MEDMNFFQKKIMEDMNCKPLKKYDVVVLFKVYFLFLFSFSINKSIFILDVYLFIINTCVFVQYMSFFNTPYDRY